MRGQKSDSSSISLPLRARLSYLGCAAVAARLGRSALWLAVHDEVVVAVDPVDAEAACRVLEECMRFEIAGFTITGTAQVLGEVWSK